MRITSIISISLLLMFNTISAQKVKRVKEKADSRTTAVYRVLKSDKQTKHGKYKEVGYWPQTLLVSGDYEFREKNGFWVTKRPGGSFISKGNYFKGKRVGKWFFYDFISKLIQEYNYDTETLLISKECGADKEYKTFIEDHFVFTKLDCPPSIVGGTIPYSMQLTNKFGHTDIWSESNNKFSL